MSKNLNPKCKQCRRAGEKLFLKGDRCASPKCGMVKRNYPPGIHGPKGKQRLSEYGQQMQEKQKAKKQYILLEKQFRLTMEKAKKQTGDLGENFLRALEERLDNVVFRLGFTNSRSQAREMVSHGHFTVNDKKVDVPSFHVKVGDIVKIKKSSQKKKLFDKMEEKIKKAHVPGWLNMDAGNLTGKVLHHPSMKDIQSNINMQMIIEYYSR